MIYSVTEIRSWKIIRSGGGGGVFFFFWYVSFFSYFVCQQCLVVYHIVSVVEIVERGSHRKSDNNRRIKADRHKLTGTKPKRTD